MKDLRGLCQGVLIGRPGSRASQAARIASAQPRSPPRHMQKVNFHIEKDLWYLKICNSHMKRAAASANGEDVYMPVRVFYIEILVPTARRLEMSPRKRRVHMRFPCSAMQKGFFHMNNQNLYMAEEGGTRAALLGSPPGSCASLSESYNNFGKGTTGENRRRKATGPCSSGAQGEAKTAGLPQAADGGRPEWTRRLGSSWFSPPHFISSRFGGEPCLASSVSSRSASRS